jgi:hypothetical protein
MMKDKMIIKALIASFFLFLLKQRECRAQGQLPDIRRVNFYRYSAVTNIETPIKKSDISIEMRPVNPDNDSRVQDLLIREGIYPNDKDVYKLLYELNPNIPRLDSLGSVSVINVPSIKKIKLTLENDNEYVVIHLDDSLIKATIKAIAEFKSKVLGSEFEATKRKFVDSNDYELLVSIGEKLEKFRSSMVNRSISFPYDVLLGINAECTLAVQILKLGQVGRPQLLNLSKINYNLSSVALRIFDIKSVTGTVPPAGTVYVRVEVIDNRNKPQTGYTVCYSFPGCENIPTCVNRLKNASSGYVFEADWSFWAVSEQKSYPPVTELKTVSVRSYDTDPIQLRKK